MAETDDYPPTLSGALNLASLNNGFAGNRTYECLSENVRQTLLFQLRGALEAYEVRAILKRVAEPSAAAREIKRLLKSLERVAEWGRSLHEDKRGAGARTLAAREMADAAGRWLDTLPADRLPPQFKRTKWQAGERSVTDYEADIALDQFFKFSMLVFGFAADAADKLSERQKGRFPLSPIEWLAGEELPALYEKITGEKFTVWINDDQSSGSPGIEFVISALLAAGLPPKFGFRHSPETIKDYRYKATRQQGDDAAANSAPG